MFPIEFNPFITFSLIIITVLVSIGGFTSEKMKEDLIFYPPAVHAGQWYRFLSSGFIHSDVFHLIFNMYAFYLFGAIVEERFVEMAGTTGRWLYLLLYLLAIWISEVPTYNRNKHNQYYSSLGASGAVAAVIFAGILLFPTLKMGFFILPMIPGFIFGPLYLLASYYLDKRGGSGVNHSAHLWGALFGVAFIILMGQLSDTPVLSQFIAQIRGWLGR